jgi:hypothetical protein
MARRSMLVTSVPTGQSAWVTNGEAKADRSRFMPRRERLRRFIAPATGVAAAALFWFIVALVVKPFEGGALALWAALMAIVVGPVCVLVAVPLGLRLRGARAGITQGVILYSAFAIVPLVISLVRS